MKVGERRRAQIITTAKRLFVEQGWHHVTMEDIAQDMGINRRTLYRYFSSKEALAMAIQVYVFEMWAARIRELHNQDSTGLKKMEELLDLIGHMSEEAIAELRFTGLFDFHFPTKYPETTETAEFLQSIYAIGQLVYDIYMSGVEDGSIRTDLDPAMTIGTIVNGFLSFAQRIVNREEKVMEEQSFESFKMIAHQKRLYIEAIRAR